MEAARTRRPPRETARRALEAYGITPRRITLAGASFNSMFHVVTDDGRHLSVRVPPQYRIHAEGSEEAEAAWLDDLADAGIDVNRVVRTQDGAASALVADPALGPDGELRCMVFEWASGQMLQRRVSGPRLVAAGELCARLHAAGADRAPSTAPRGVPAGDRIVYFTVPDRLSTLRARYGSLFDDARVRAEAALSRLWAEHGSRAHLVHGDFTPANLIVCRQRVTAIDFQDMIWAPEELDLAMVVAVLRRADDHEQQIASFRRGYERHRRWPDVQPAELDDLVAVRRLSITNLNLALPWPNAATTIERHAEMLRQHLRRA